MVRRGSEDMLRQNVFSSIHLSTELRRGETSITYPSCSFCGGAVNGKKPSSTRKVTSCQLSLYTNSSESFIVWFKKPEEPKGLLWLRSCHVRRGSTVVDGCCPIELISIGCRGRCSYTLRFSQLPSTEEWYRLLRHESRKNADYDDPSDTSEEESPLDRLLSDVEEESDWSAGQDRREHREARGSPPSSGRTSPKKPSTKTKNRSFRIQISSFGRSERKPCVPLTGGTAIVDCPASPDSGSDSISRWTWPLKV